MREFFKSLLLEFSKRKPILLRTIYTLDGVYGLDTDGNLHKLALDTEDRLMLGRFHGFQDAPGAVPGKRMAPGVATEEEALRAFRQRPGERRYPRREFTN